MKVINDLKEIDPTLSIETLYNAQPPFMQPDDAKAPLGVLLYDKLNDKVMCHMKTLAAPGSVLNDADESLHLLMEKHPSYSNSRNVSFSELSKVSQMGYGGNTI